MNLIAFECSKCRDGYRIVTYGRRSKGGARKLPNRPLPTYLVPATDQFYLYSPLDVPAVFARFAEAPANAEGMRQFADNFGLPGSGPGAIEHRHSISSLLENQAVMRRALGALEKGDKQELIKLLHEGHTRAGPFDIPGQSGLARLELRLGPAGRLETAIVPPTLMQAMWIQFLLHAASDAQLFRCEQCRKPFVVGSGTKRRSTAKYCSNACKVAAFKARQEA